jgi:biopolymer transport protein ExbD/biopolymer transport protein TolR
VGGGGKVDSGAIQVPNRDEIVEVTNVLFRRDARNINLTFGVCLSMSSLWRMRSNRINRPDKLGFSAVFAIIAALLLMILMTLPSPHRGIGIYLPRASAAITMRRATSNNAVMVAITRDGTIFVGNDRAEPTMVAEKIQTLIAGTSERKVYIRADARAPYGAVASVLDGVREVGIHNVAFIVDQRKDESESK